MITSFPPHVASSDLDDMIKDRDESVAKWGTSRYVQAYLDMGEKIDVYSQIQMNWTAFITYVWANREKIYKPRKAKVTA